MARFMVKVEDDGFALAASRPFRKLASLQIPDTLRATPNVRFLEQSQYEESTRLRHWRRPLRVASLFSKGMAAL